MHCAMLMKVSRKGISMSATATLNIRLPEDLKEHGMQVLARENVSVSDLVRSLFQELEETQTLPEFALRNKRAAEGEIRRKREVLRDMVGVLPAETSPEDARLQRLEYKCRPGVRE